MRRALLYRAGVPLCIALAALVVLPVSGPAAETALRGGELVFIVPASGFPSMDAHREETYALIHPLAPFYSVLIKVNPANPSDTTHFVGDVAERWSSSADGRTYTFTLRHGGKFHEGSALTARDVKASVDKIIFPPDGMPSVRKAMFFMVKSVQARNDDTVVFDLSFPTAAFLPAVANPYNWSTRRSCSPRMSAGTRAT